MHTLAEQAGGFIVGGVLGVFLGVVTNHTLYRAVRYRDR